MTARLDRIAPMLAHEEPEQRRVAVKELVGLREDGVVALFVRALGDEDWRVRKEAATLAPHVEPKEELFAKLKAALDDKQNIGLRNAAVEALVNLGPDAVTPALAALDELDADGRKLAVEVLAGVPDGRGVERLITALDDEDSNVGHAAAEALGKAGLASEGARKQATAALASCLDRRDVALVLAALESLVRLDARLPYARILPLARHPLLRRVAIAAAAHSREEPALGVLIEAAGSGPSSIAREATIALAGWMRETPAKSKLVERAGELLRKVGGVHERLRLATAEGDPELRSAAFLLLGAVRDLTDLPMLVAALDDEESGGGALNGLELFGPAAAPGLASLLELADVSTKPTILSLLASLATPVEARTLRTVRDCLADASAEVVSAAATALASFGDERDLGRLVSLAIHGDPRIAEAATSAVHMLAWRHPIAARALLGALDPTAEHAAAGAAIVSALARIDPDARGEGATRELITFGERALRSADPRARRLAIEALAASGDKEANEKIRLALADEEREVRLTAVRALGTLGADSTLQGLVRDSTDQETVSVALRSLAAANLPMALDVARELVPAEDAALASAAVEVLSRDVGPHREEGLGIALSHSDKDVVMLALTELGAGATHEPRAYHLIAGCLSHSSWEVRRLASEILGQDRSPAARALLRARLELELEPAVREALTEALSIRPPRDGASAGAGEGSE